MSTTQLTIKRWRAWMPGISTRQDWQAWRQGRKQPVAGGAPEVREIPPMLRRRLSPLGKMAVSVAWPLLSDTDRLPSLFCSRHGELVRTVGMLRSLAVGEALSPTQFSLSVHNALGGVFSIARRDTSPVSALAVGEAGFSQALLETRLILSEQGAPEALCLVYDAPLPDVYSDFSCEPEWPYAAAFVLGATTSTASDGTALELEPCSAGAAVNVPGPHNEAQALSFLRFLLADNCRDLYLPSRRDFWHWRKAGAGR